MSPERWQQVKSLLDTCLERPAAERQRLLSQPGVDAEVRAEVESLLAACSDATSFLEAGPAANGDLAGALTADPWIGAQLGAFTIEAEVGRGGMGTVYRAVREDDGFRREVAIKIVSRGGETEPVIRRFRNERQILAGLDHPYIARLIDGGTTPSGLPYFVMEYVQGAPLHAYCDERRLTIAQRLELFRKVAEAVSYAHRHLIVHRDLKPSNILVTDDGTPKLLDFGIAKIVHETGESAAEPTVTVRMATPKYASPEQIRGELVGTSSDVYSLGVILYELLTGHSPYAVHRGETRDLTSIICEQEPTRPSQVLASLENYDVSSGDDRPVDSTVLCERRSTTPEALERRLRGELDNIVAMALRKEPERRYVSVEQFSDDVRRHLEGLPVLARKDTLGYRTGKFVARHKIGVGLGAAAILLLCVSTALAVVKARQLALRLEEDHKLATSFLVNIHDSIAKLPGATPVREALLEESLRYMNGLAKESGSDRDLQRGLALAYEKVAELQAGASGAGLGQPTRALDTLLLAQAIRERLAAAEPERIELRAELVRNYLLASYPLGRTRSMDERIANDRKALAGAQQLAEPEPGRSEYQELLARAHSNLAYAHAIGDDWEPARKHYAEALAIRTRRLAEQPRNPEARQSLAQIEYRLGMTYAQAGEPLQALEHLGRAHTIQNQLAAEQPHNTQVQSELASTLHYSGVALAAAGRFGEALERLDEAIAMREAAAARDAKDARARTLLAGNYAERASVQLKAGDAKGALTAMRKAITLQQASYELDPNSVPTRITLADQYSRLGSIYAAVGAKAESLVALRQSAGLYEQLRAQGHLRSPVILADADRVRATLVRLESGSAR